MAYVLYKLGEPIVIAYYTAGILKIDRIGTHAEYDKWDLK